MVELWTHRPNSGGRVLQVRTVMDAASALQEPMSARAAGILKCGPAGSRRVRGLSHVILSAPEANRGDPAQPAEFVVAVREARKTRGWDVGSVPTLDISTGTIVNSQLPISQGLVRQTPRRLKPYKPWSQRQELLWRINPGHSLFQTCGPGCSSCALRYAFPS